MRQELTLRMQTVRDSPKSYHFRPGACENSPWSRPFGSSVFTSCNTSGRRVTIPVPRGRKSRPTTASSTDDFPELCAWGATIRARQPERGPHLTGTARAKTQTARLPCASASCRTAMAAHAAPTHCLESCCGGVYSCMRGAGVLQASYTHLPSHDDDRGQPVPQDALRAERVVPQRRTNLLELVDEPNDPLHT
jgi:hypothetical protein